MVTIELTPDTARYLKRALRQRPDAAFSDAELRQLYAAYAGLFTGNTVAAQGGPIEAWVMGNMIQQVLNTAGYPVLPFPCPQ